MKKIPMKGFTLVEIVVVLFIMTTFLLLITINLSSSQQRASITSFTDVFISDFRGQQVKAMVGDSEGRPGADHYGVSLDNNSYTLFHGSYYSSSDSANFTITLDPQFIFTDSEKDIIFTRFTGEVANYNPLDNQIIIQDSDNGNQKTIQYNKYGVVISVD